MYKKFFKGAIYLVLSVTMGRDPVEHAKSHPLCGCVSAATPKNHLSSYNKIVQVYCKKER